MTAGHKALMDSKRAVVVDLKDVLEAYYTLSDAADSEIRFIVRQRA